MKKTLRLNETDLIRLIKTIIKEQNTNLIGKSVNLFWDKDEKNFWTQIKIKQLTYDGYNGIRKVIIEPEPNEVTKRYELVKVFCDDDQVLFLDKKYAPQHGRGFYNKKFIETIKNQYCKVPKSDYQP